MLLVDEVDRADDEFEAFLLEVLTDCTISVPELGTIRAEAPPVVVVTCNRTREVHDALKRRCLYHWLDHPDFDREVAILRRRLPEARPTAGARGRRGRSHALRARRPAQAAGRRRVPRLGRGAARARRAAGSTRGWRLRRLGAVLKYREDAERVRALDVGALVARAVIGA